MRLKIQRCKNNPIIYPGMEGLEGELGENINGPTLIKVPAWIQNPLGKYYLYFAHHHGKFIRLAHSDVIEGPYKIFPKGTLSTQDIAKLTNKQINHIASPEIIIKNDVKEIWMYYHISIRGLPPFKDQSQTTFLAKSKDGINFTHNIGPLAPYYLRLFFYDGYFYGLAKNDNKGGIFVRSKTGQTIFERGKRFIKGFRHNSILLDENNKQLFIFYSQVGDFPERILLSRLNLNKDWKKWKPEPPIEVIRPEYDFEGVELPIEKSRHGSTKPTQSLRDPYIFSENNQLYLLYSIKGEFGIAIAKIEINEAED